MQDLVAKILAPRKPVKVRDKTYWVKQNVPWELQLKAELVCQETMSQFRFAGMLRREEVDFFLRRSGVPLDYLEEWTERIKTLKVNLYNKYPDTFSQKPIRSELKQLKDEISSIHHRRYIVDRFTLEGYSEREAHFFILRHLAKCPDDFNLLESIQYQLLLDSPSIAQIRQLARSEYWRTYWGAKKGAAFKYQPLTDEQLSLASYSKMYENILKHPDVPEDEIISDDDMLDGWMILQAQEKNKKKGPSFGHKINSAQEVFVMAKDQDHANKIYSMNTDEQRAVQNVRKKQLKKQGAMKFGNFADQQRQQRAMQHAQR